MMKYRPLLLVLVCLALAALRGFDNEEMLLSMWRTDPPAARRQITMERKPGGEPVADAAQSKPSSSLQVGNPLASFKKASLENWVNRPLFAPSRRRPPPKPAQIGNVAPPPPPDYQLVGVVLNADRTVALLRSEENGANFHVEVGDVVGGWRVTSVDRNAVTLKRDDETPQIIRFKKDCTDSSSSPCP
jgi:hypothetical protein